MAERSLALVGGTLVDGSGREPVAGAVVLVEGAMITRVGGAEVRLPAGCRIIDVAGCTVLPGLMDLHVHLYIGDLDVIVPSGGLPPGLDEAWPLRALKSYAYARRTLEMGFTTLRDVGDMGYIAVSLRDAIATGIVPGPRIVASGKFLTTTGGHVDLMPPWAQRTDDESNVADGVDGVVRAVREQCKLKTDWIKFYATGGVMDPEDKQEFNDQEMAALIGAAHAREKPVCCHALYTEGFLAAVKLGVDSVEHGAGLTEEIAEMMIDQGTWLVPTINGFETLIAYGVEGGLPASYVERLRPIGASHVASFKLALETGVPIAYGTDCGFNAIRHGNNALEMKYLVRHGMSPMEALMTATSRSAQCLGVDDRLGTVEEGKLADLVVVKGDPLADVTILEEKDKIGLVIKEGTIYANRL